MRDTLVNYIYEIVDAYIDNEIDYIKRKEDCSSISKEDIKDLYMLENITPNKKMEIADKIVGNFDLEEKINELVHSELYERSDK